MATCGSRKMTAIGSWHYPAGRRHRVQCRHQPWRGAFHHYGADGNLWVVESSLARIARITPAAVRVIDAFSAGITAGANLSRSRPAPWQPVVHGTFRRPDRWITTSGVVTEFSAARPGVGP